VRSSSPLLLREPHDFDNVVLIRAPWTSVHPSLTTNEYSRARTKMTPIRKRNAVIVFVSTPYR